MFICFHFNSHSTIKNANHRMLEQVGESSQTVQSKVLVCDSKWASSARPLGRYLYLTQNDRMGLPALFCCLNDIPELMYNIQVTTFPFLLTFKCTADGNLWSAKYSFCFPCFSLSLCMVSALTVPRCKSYCFSGIRFEERSLSVLP